MSLCAGVKSISLISYLEVRYTGWFQKVSYALHGLSYRNSVRPSVCPSLCHTRALCPHGLTYGHDSSPYGSHIILVSGDIKFIPKFEGDHPERGR